MAGAMAEIAHRSLPEDFRAIDTKTARIVLVEGEPRLLGAFPESLSARAQRDLERLGVEVRLNQRVTRVDARGVMIGDERIDAACIIWAAGVRAEPLAATLGVPLDRAGRVPVEPDLSAPGRPEVFVIGDLALVQDPRTGRPVPGIAPAAMQMGRHAARVIRDEVARRAGARSRFRYLDKGILATIGRARAVAVIRGMRFAGFPAWALWAGVHIFFLIGFRNRLLVAVQWAWEWACFQRGARLIVGERKREEG
jgi:NADH dehydrogenase